MKAQYLIPSPALAQFVSGLLTIEDANDSRAFTIPLFANGNPTLVFQTAKAVKGIETVGHVSLYGQTIQPAELVFREPVTFIACFFYPHALKSLFDIDPREITDQYLDSTLLKHVGVFRLQEQLLHAASPAACLLLIEKYIVQLAAAQKKKEDERIVFATEALKGSRGLASLPDLRKELHITERSFQRLFESHIGITPNQYKRICQFQFAFQQVNQNQFSKLTHIAYDSGFADQSHFIKVFREFAGKTPNEYLAQLAPYNPEF